jgi:hypothetical protein
MRYLLLIPILLIAGYVIARNHHRLRNLGIGWLVGSSLPPLPDTSDYDGHSHDRHDRSHGHDHYDHSHDHGHYDHSFGADSTHTDSTGHSF